MRSDASRFFRFIAALLAMALLVAATAGALNDLDDDADDGDIAADISDVVTMGVPPVLAVYAPCFGETVMRHAPPRDTGRELARRIFRPPI